MRTATHAQCADVLQAIPRVAGIPANKTERRKYMKLASSKLTASAASLFAFGLIAMATTSAQADDYCITNGAQAAHGCGYQTMEACRAAASGIGGTCSQSSSSKTSGDAMAFQPHQSQARSRPHRNQATGS
jgi:hypothetical protein